MRFLTKLIGSSCMVPVVVFGISAYERTLIDVEHYSIKSEKLPPEFDGMKIVFLSDLHNACFGKDNERLIRMIEEEGPDIILVGGDMIVGKPGASAEIGYSLLKRLSTKYPLICANGNHEFRMNLYKETYGTRYHDYTTALRECGIVYLENSTVVLRKGKSGICISGLDIARRYYQRGFKTSMDAGYLNQVLGKKNPEEFHILLAHNPIYFPEYADWGADLVLSGHNHGGLVRIPYFGGVISPQLTLFPKYDAGYFQKDHSQMIISRGLGTHTIHIRVCNHPELSVIHLYRRKNFE